MSMTFEFYVNPFGSHANRVKMAEMHVYSAGTMHRYELDFQTEVDWVRVEGAVPKQMPDGTRRSGHRNFVHLLDDIIKDIDPAALGSDYVHILEEIREVAGNPKIRASDYPGE